MPKYIDADALLNEAKKLSGPQTGDGWSNWGVYALIERQPAADVVDVVRCKDCKHRDPEDLKCDCGGLERAGCIFSVSDNYFCAHGERKEKM